MHFNTVNKWNERLFILMTYITNNELIVHLCDRFFAESASLNIILWNFAKSTTLHTLFLVKHFQKRDFLYKNHILKCNMYPGKFELCKLLIFFWFSYTLLCESMRAWICPSKISCINSSSSAETVLLNAIAILFISALKYGLKYCINALFLIWVYRVLTCGAIYISNRMLSLISSSNFRHEAYLDS